MTASSILSQTKKTAEVKTTKATVRLYAAPLYRKSIMQK